MSLAHALPVSEDKALSNSCFLLFVVGLFDAVIFDVQRCRI